MKELLEVWFYRAMMVIGFATMVNLIVRMTIDTIDTRFKDKCSEVADRREIKDGGVWFSKTLDGKCYVRDSFEPWEQVRP